MKRKVPFKIFIAYLSFRDTFQYDWKNKTEKTDYVRRNETKSKFLATGILTVSTSSPRNFDPSKPKKYYSFDKNRPTMDTSVQKNLHKSRNFPKKSTSGLFPLNARGPTPHPTRMIRELYIVFIYLSCIALSISNVPEFGKARGQHGVRFISVRK